MNFKGKMMLEDVLFKLARKSLSPDLYRVVAGGFFGRRKKYHKISTYLEIFEHYVQQGLLFNDQVVIEVGPGQQFFTAFSMLTKGAKKVLLVDPEISMEMMPQQLSEYERVWEGAKTLKAGEKIFCFKSLAEIPTDFNSKADIICSNHVLEHFSELESFFLHNRRLIADSGISYNRVDLSDHTYHVFDRFKVTQRINHGRSLYHLRYSKRMFDFLNDGKCYMNRILLPSYLDLASRFDLKVENLQVVKYKETEIHPQLLSDFMSRNPQELYITEFSFRLRI